MSNPALAGTDEDLRGQAGAALGRLHGWFNGVRQRDGYGGPVVHWWRHSLRYTGPGLDWRYEGILAGYAQLADAYPEARWQEARDRAMEDLKAGQADNGSYRGSRFEQNPGTDGTPHEAAATLGLLRAMRRHPYADAFMPIVERSLEHHIEVFWDERRQSFNDHPTAVGFVPNKLATLAEALIDWNQYGGPEAALDKAKAALDTVLHYQTSSGRWRGAVHQYAPGGLGGDGRFFPYYNARCIPPLLRAAEVLGDDSYRHAALAIIEFLDATMHADGSWPQIVYARGRVADGPRWMAGVADILRSYWLTGAAVPRRALERLLQGQLASGAFATADGFGGMAEMPDWHDLVPVAGWNDKAFRFLVEWLGSGANLQAEPTLGTEQREVRIGRVRGVWRESGQALELFDRDGGLLYRWNKSEPWAWAASSAIVEG